MASDLEKFLYLATHDLKEPARKISTFGDRLKRELDGNLNEKAELFLSKMIDSANRMQEMLDKLHELSRIKTDAQAFETLDLYELENIRPYLQTKNLSVYGDRKLISRLFDELLDNALKFGSIPNPEIVINSEKTEEEGFVKITFENAGNAIEKEFETEIFFPFKKLNGKNDFPGFGMGLVIADKIAKLHGGRIFLKNDQAYSNRFYILLPSQKAIE